MGIGVILFFMIVAFAISAAQKQATDQSWSAVGRRTGLSTTRTSMFRNPSMSGTIKGVHVDARVVSRGTGDSQRKVTQYTVTFPSLGPPVQFRRQGMGSFFRGMFGGDDAIVGDPRFDATVEIDAPNSTALREFLTPARRAAILSIFSTWPNAQITNTTIRVETRRVERNQDRLMASLNRLVDSARLLADPGPVNAALSRREDGDLTEAAAALHDAVEADPEPNVVARVLEAETLIALDRAEEAKPILAQAATVLPGDPEVAGWAAVADEQITRHDAAANDDDPGAPADPDDATDAAVTSSLPAPPPPPPGESASAPGPAVALDQQATIDALFGGGLLGHEIEHAFETRYAGTTVTWTGEVENSRGYRSDRDFGGEPGTKTTVRLGAVGESALMSNRVKAVVDLPAGTELARGDEVRFTGTLLRVDRFTRTIYIADAAPA